MSYETALGKAIVPTADIADVAADVNAAYPNGIGKQKGMMVYEDTGSILRIMLAQGAAPTDDWSVVTESTAAEVASETVTPA